ncbi:extracellular solute-binding protein [Caldilinea sp.]|jgi:multiple sugar transport system substrate-binding protein|uniref:extracellular solute-binding protein n=1 Tax=Caldilinea sp. TaxID=2293560 RepID=UPI0026231198|nr:extracellular solute-binding protein [uncultured Caldilinea sp.]
MQLVRWVSFFLVLSLLIGCTAPVAAPSAAPAPSTQTVLRALFMQQAGYQQSDIEAITQEYEAQNLDVDVQLDFVAYEALHDKIVTAAAAGAGGYDVVLMDCIWPAEFASADFILDVTDRIPEDVRADIWPGALEAVTWQGRLYGMPWLNDVLYLYYNKEMLEKAGFSAPPKTWSELREMGLAAKAQGLVEYPFIEYFQQDEGLTIAFAYYLFAFGGSFFDEEGKPTFNSQEGLAALNFMVNGLKDGLINPASLESTYEEVRRTFSQGASLFSVNWAYQLNLANDPAESQIVGNAIVTLMPGEVEPSATINGGMGLAIMKSSQNPDRAWEYIQFLSSKDVQKRYSQNALPIWKSLFDDPELLEMQPAVAREQDFVNVSKQQYAFLRNRPIVPYYSETSEIIAREVQAALTGAKTPEQALADAEAAILKVREQYQ